MKTVFACKCTMDKTMRITSAVVIGLLAGIAAVLGYLALWPSEAGAEGRLFLLLPAVASALVPVFCLAYAPRSVKITWNAIVVCRRGPDLVIPLSEVRSGENLDRVTPFTLRTCGSSGLFGCFGWFWNRRLGSFRMSVTRVRDYVILFTAKRPVVLSPDDREGFLAALETALGEEGPGDEGE